MTIVTFLWNVFLTILLVCGLLVAVLLFLFIIGSIRDAIIKVMYGKDS